jgi:hypothetical protein
LKTQWLNIRQYDACNFILTRQCLLVYNVDLFGWILFSKGAPAFYPYLPILRESLLFFYMWILHFIAVEFKLIRNAESCLQCNTNWSYVLILNWSCLFTLRLFLYFYLTYFPLKNSDRRYSLRKVLIFLFGFFTIFICCWFDDQQKLATFVQLMLRVKNESIKRKMKQNTWNTMFVCFLFNFLNESIILLQETLSNFRNRHFWLILLNLSKVL